MSAVIRIEPRWTDLDPVGHVNNSVFLVYAEEARNRFLHEHLPNAWDWIVVVHNSIDYHRPVELADIAVDVSADVEKVGRSSFTSLSLIATQNGELCATVRTVQAVVGGDRSATRPWTESERAVLESLLIAR